MPVRNITPKIVYLDNLVHECGYFFNSGDLNNGYGCKSRSRHKDEKGCCFGFDCPLAHEPTLAQLKELDKDIYEEYKDFFAEDLAKGKTEEDCDLGFYTSDVLIQYREHTKSKKEKRVHVSAL